MRQHGVLFRTSMSHGGSIIQRQTLGQGSMWWNGTITVCCYGFEDGEIARMDFGGLRKWSLLGKAFRCRLCLLYHGSMLFYITNSAVPFYPNTLEYYVLRSMCAKAVDVVLKIGLQNIYMYLVLKVSHFVLQQHTYPALIFCWQRCQQQYWFCWAQLQWILCLSSRLLLRTLFSGFLWKAIKCFGVFILVL